MNNKGKRGASKTTKLEASYKELAACLKSKQGKLPSWYKIQTNGKKEGLNEKSYKTVKAAFDKTNFTQNKIYEILVLCSDAADYNKHDYTNVVEEIIQRHSTDSKKKVNETMFSTIQNMAMVSSLLTDEILCFEAFWPATIRLFGKDSKNAYAKKEGVQKCNLTVGVVNKIRNQFNDLLSRALFEYDAMFQSADMIGFEFNTTNTHLDYMRTEYVEKVSDILKSIYDQCRISENYTSCVSFGEDNKIRSSTEANLVALIHTYYTKNKTNAKLYENAGCQTIIDNSKIKFEIPERYSIKDDELEEFCKYCEAAFRKNNLNIDVKENLKDYFCPKRFALDLLIAYDDREPIAFEFDGARHYKPFYSKQIKDNEARVKEQNVALVSNLARCFIKGKLAKKAGIKLVVLDTSKDFSVTREELFKVL